MLKAFFQNFIKNTTADELKIFFLSLALPMVCGIQVILSLYFVDELALENQMALAKMGIYFGFSFTLGSITIVALIYKVSVYIYRRLHAKN